MKEGLPKTVLLVAPNNCDLWKGKATSKNSRHGFPEAKYCRRAKQAPKNSAWGAPKLRAFREGGATGRGAAEDSRKPLFMKTTPPQNKVVGSFFACLRSPHQTMAVFFSGAAPSSSTCFSSNACPSSRLCLLLA